MAECETAVAPCFGIRCLTSEAIRAGQLSPVMVPLIEEAAKAGDWEACLLYFPKPWRRAVLEEIAPIVSDRQYWELLAGAWVGTEAPTFHRAAWLRLFGSTRPGRNYLMTAKEHAALAALPDPITVYRGAPLKIARGMSWTVDLERAAWFARRWAHRDGSILRAVIPKRKVLAYFQERKEAEVVIDPRRLNYEVLNPGAWMVASRLRGRIQGIIDGFGGAARRKSA